MLTAWTGSPIIHVAVVGHGRQPFFDELDVSRTVADLTYRSQYLFDLTGVETPGAALTAIKTQLRQVPLGGMSCDLLRYINQNPAIHEQMRVVPHYDITFNYRGQLEMSAVRALPAQFATIRSASESVGAISDPQQAREQLLDFNSGIEGDRFVVQWSYSENLHKRETIEQLAAAFFDAVRTLMGYCQIEANQVGDAGGIK